jgi:predicted amidohydrolase YtcJ
MLDERTTDPAEVRAGVIAAWGAGRAVALHAVSEAEVAIALDVLRGAPAGLGPGPNRIEHAAVLPDALMEDVRASGAMVVGQPALVYDRGDVYLREYEAEQHGWLHRACSLLATGIPYAAGSDAPVTDPWPGPGFVAARRRRTWRGALLGVDEALSEQQALAALTLGPARAVGAAHELGQLRPGALADIAILDAAALDAADLQAWEGAVCFTIMEGKVVWERR